MARSPPPSPLNGLAISGGIFFCGFPNSFQRFTGNKSRFAPLKPAPCSPFRHCRHYIFETGKNYEHTHMPQIRSHYFTSCLAKPKFKCIKMLYCTFTIRGTIKEHSYTQIAWTRISGPLFKVRKAFEKSNVKEDAQFVSGRTTKDRIPRWIKRYKNSIQPFSIAGGPTYFVSHPQKDITI